MDCRGFDECMSLDLDGRLDAGRKEELLKHLAACPQCRVEAENARKAESLLAALPRRAASGGFEDSLMRRIDAGEAAAHRSGRLFPGLGRLASVAAGVAIGVAIAGVFHFTVGGGIAGRSADRNAPGPSAPVRQEEPNLVRLAGNTLGRNLHAMELFNSDAHDLPCNEPEVASDILEKEIRMLDIPGRMAEIRRFEDVYRNRNTGGWDFIEDVMRNTAGVVEGVRSMSGRARPDDPVMGGIRLRAGESLRRIEAAWEIFGPEFAPPPVLVGDAGGPGRPAGRVPEDSGPAQLYVNGLNLWASGQGDPAMKLFLEIDKSYAGTAFARRARDMTIMILADKSRFKGDVQSMMTIEKLLGEDIFISEVTMTRLAGLVNLMEGSGGPAADFGKNVKVRIMGLQAQRTVACPTMAAHALASVGTLTGIEMNGRKVEMRQEDFPRVLAAVRRLPSAWQVMSMSTTFGSRGGVREIAVVLVLPRGSACAYPPELAADFAALDKAYPGSFDSSKLERIAVQGMGN